MEDSTLHQKRRLKKLKGTNYGRSKSGYSEGERNIRKKEKREGMYKQKRKEKPGPSPCRLVLGSGGGRVGGIELYMFPGFPGKKKLHDR